MNIIVVRTIAELRKALAPMLHEAAQRQTAQRGIDRATSGSGIGYGLVPTMGALHEGHARLAEAAVAECAVTVASVFVNPLQFGDQGDLERYPRTLEHDAAVLEAAGVNLLFAPTVAEMYPYGEPSVRLDGGELGRVFEGAFRPGHFGGVLTVVAKLLHCCAPASAGAPVEYRAYFGQKDVQQLALIRRMVEDLNFPVQIVGVPTVRAEDGLALSSRNRFLSAQERTAALVLYRALRLLAERARRGEPLDLDSAVAIVRNESLVGLDYFEVVDPRTFAPLAEDCRQMPLNGSALALIAARVGTVRLIDNMPLSV